ncbi:2-amino-4-hydroxy-6-hydroxymethyldihydropteridine diphosphokinase [Cohaesibacter celericrescens]|uniref:2-amino-4-hydroxy-6-hydroxymethyldihydropteridine pyrophosphokinase n=1 Tax=Cohaesibacter celericrescens TaxID=2067669 RepID=A0A2N5XVT5_9HYPH|nr:2-amino-4-hydroxy-6-hydroxymethyldihydropteridine diphosphokinase [Cohaesibacter celericrescens]PLW78538.1 2-amino-4-hydroxy-6-hydroxymethyldihydropteridine diphosphokinase [Cohaesibacter celericrescens]
MNKDRSEIEVFISLGGNIGDPSVTIEDALFNLSSQPGISVTTRSPYYKTPPWGKTDQAEFINACARLVTTLSPQDLLAACLDIETRMGRKREERWGPRTIDIDILTYGDLVVQEDNLSLPHPEIENRAFVLIPLRDIAADFQLNGKSIAAMLQNLDISGIKLMDPPATPG